MGLYNASRYKCSVKITPNHSDTKSSVLAWPLLFGEFDPRTLELAWSNSLRTIGWSASTEGLEIKGRRIWICTWTYGYMYPLTITLTIV